MSVIAGESSQLIRIDPKFEKPSNECIPYVPTVGKGTISAQSTAESDSLRITLPPPPVYVQKEDGEEQLMCNSRFMEKNKPYPVIWNGIRYVLIKEKDGVGLYQHEDDHG